jgi:hypothetical protein
MRPKTTLPDEVRERHLSFPMAAFGLQFQAFVWLWHLRPGINTIMLPSFEQISNPKMTGGV